MMTLTERFDIIRDLQKRLDERGAAARQAETKADFWHKKYCDLLREVESQQAAGKQ